MTARFDELRHVPHSALLLGFGGALPFVVAGLLALAGPPASIWAVQALLGYGAVILSFMGGIHWGLAMASGRLGLIRLGGSVLPALIGWASLLRGGAMAFLVMAAAFIALLAYDVHITRQGQTPNWYPSLRLPLTMVVVICLCLGALAA